MHYSPLLRAGLLAGLVLTSSMAGAEVRQVTEPIALFNGKDLTGFYTFLRDHGANNNPNQVFTVHDGMIHISGQDYGCITSHESFK